MNELHRWLHIKFTHCGSIWYPLYSIQFVELRMNATSEGAHYYNLFKQWFDLFCGVMYAMYQLLDSKCFVLYGKSIRRSTHMISSTYMSINWWGKEKNIFWTDYRLFECKLYGCSLMVHSHWTGHDTLWMDTSYSFSPLDGVCKESVFQEEPCNTIEVHEIT